MVNLKKAAIIGLGNVGASIAFHLMTTNLFSELVLIDIAKDKAEGEAMDLSHGLPYCSSVMDIHHGDYEDIKDASVIILTSGAAQKVGETRLDLIHKNVAILRSILKELKRVEMEGILLLVANPVDILTHFAVKELGIPKSRVFGSGTVLDTARLKFLLSQRLEVDPRNVHAVIIGEHGDSELAVDSIANISSMPLEDFMDYKGIENKGEVLQEIDKEVRESAYEIISKKGSTYYGIAMSVGRICSAIVNDEHSMLPVSVELDGEYGLKDIALSIPSIVGRKGVEHILEIPLSVSERRKLIRSGESLGEVIRSVNEKQ